MVQNLSLSTLTISGGCGISGSSTSWRRRHFKLIKKTHNAFGTDNNHCSLHQIFLCLYFVGNPNLSRYRNLRVDVGWLFNKGGNKESEASCERSESANEDILIFFFQLDLATRVQVWWIVFEFWWFSFYDIICIPFCCNSHKLFVVGCRKL